MRLLSRPLVAGGVRFGREDAALEVVWRCVQDDRPLLQLVDETGICEGVPRDGIEVEARVALQPVGHEAVEDERRVVSIARTEGEELRAESWAEESEAARLVVGQLGVACYRSAL